MNEARARRKQSERTAEARRKLLDATVELIGLRGLEGFSLADVGERAGVSRGLPGHHFKTRERLVDLAVAELLDPAGAAGEPGLERLLTALRRGLEPSARRSALVVILSAPSQPSHRAEAVRARLKAMEDGFEADLRAAAAAGRVRRGLDAALLSRFLACALLGEALASDGGSAARASERAESFVTSVRLLLGIAGEAAPAGSEAAAKPAGRGHPTPTSSEQLNLFE